MRPPSARAWSLLLPLATLFVAGVVAGCGGGGGSGGGANSTASTPPTAGGTATSILHQAGFAVCSDATRNFPASATDIPGLQGTRAFFVAKGSCNGAKTTPNWIAAFVFTSADSFNSGQQTIKRAMRKSAVYATYPLVIASTGPDKEANLEALKPYLPPPTNTGTGTVTTTTTSG
jgi:hypothetical protein